VSIRLLIFRIYSTHKKSDNATNPTSFGNKNPLFSCAHHALVSCDRATISTASCPLARRADPRKFGATNLLCGQQQNGSPTTKKPSTTQRTLITYIQVLLSSHFNAKLDNTR
jgi:hypothetical protein